MVKKRMFQFKKKKKDPKTLKEVLTLFRKLEKETTDISRELEEFKEKSRRDLQKFGIVRFNPFKEIGGDQSFSIAMLNEEDSGLVITSHYGRESNRVYAKPVVRGASEYSLSEEEEKAINKAITER